MKSYLSLAFRELKAQKLMAVLILIAVMLSSMMTAAMGNSLEILQNMRIHQATSLNGDRYATFHQLTEEQTKILQEDSRLLEVGNVIPVGSTRLGDSSLTLYLREYQNHALDAYPAIGKLKEGRLPEKPYEIALPQNALSYLGKGLKPGDSITIKGEVSRMDGSIPSYEYAAEFFISGILEGNYIGYSTGTLDAVVGEGTAVDLLPKAYVLYSTDFKTRDSMQFQRIVYELADKVSVEKSNIQYNWILLDALKIPYEEKGASDTETGFSFMTVACVMVGALVLLAAGLVIYNILKIAVTKRIREYGTLRAMGSTKLQIYKLVTLQLLILCGIGIPIGLLAGGLSAKGILMAATGVLNPDLFLADSTQTLQTMISHTSSGKLSVYLVSSFVTLCFAIFAAFPVAHYASSVSPTVAMAGQKVSIKRQRRKAKKISNFEAYYARLNLKRGRSRTVITILSLVMSITVFVALQSFTILLDTSKNVENLHTGDYAITNETAGISLESAAKVQESEWVENLNTAKLTIYTQDKQGRLPVTLGFQLQSWETFQVASLDEMRLTSWTEGLSEEEKKELLKGEGCLVKNPIPFAYEGEVIKATNFQKGDKITVNEREMRVVGIADSAVTINNEGFQNGIQVIVNHKIYEEITGNQQYGEIYPTLKKSADARAFENWLETWTEENPGSHWISYRQTSAQLEESFAQIKMLCWGLIFFIGLIGILNIINTVYSNLHTRIAEIGMQRAIGMSAGSLYKTFLWEGAYYGIIASVAGSLLGYICTMFIQAAITDSLELVAIPVTSIVQASTLAICACLLATAVPLRSIAKMNIVESISQFLL